MNKLEEWAESDIPSTAHKAFIKSTGLSQGDADTADFLRYGKPFLLLHSIGSEYDHSQIEAYVEKDIASVIRITESKSFHFKNIDHSSIA